MTKGQGTIAGLLVTANALLVANLIVSATAGPRALAADEPPDETAPALFREQVLPVPEPPELPTFVAQPTPVLSGSEIQALPDVVRARAFEVVDDQGRVVIRMGLDGNGEAGIVTTDSGGSPLTVFGAFRGGGMISTFNRFGKPLVMMRQNYHGKGEIILGPPDAED